MSFGTALKLYDNRVCANLKNYSGSGEDRFWVLSGSRLLVTMRLMNAQPGAMATVHIDNCEAQDGPFDRLDTLTLSGNGVVKRVYSDFHNLFKIPFSVVGGQADLRVSVALFDNSALTKIENAQISVNLSHLIDALGNFDSIRIGDGQYLLKIEPDGYVGITQRDPLDEITINPYDQQTAVPASTETTLLTYTVPVGKQAFLQRAECSGQNIGRYRIYLNGNPIGTQRTYLGGDLNARFEFSGPQKRTQPLASGDVVTVKVLHSRPTPGDFEARLQVVEKG